MARPLRYRLVLALVLATASPLAAAAGWAAIFRNTPVEDFNDEDLRLYVDAVRQVLDAPPPPQALAWRNEASGAGGELLVVAQPRIKAQGECRRVRSTLHSKKRSGRASWFTACRQGDGRWMLHSAT